MSKPRYKYDEEPEELDGEPDLDTELTDPDGELYHIDNERDRDRDWQYRY